jgi:hypothetical protein
MDSFIGLQVTDVLHTTFLSRVNVSWFFWLMEKPPFVEGGFSFSGIFWESSIVEALSSKCCNPSPLRI